MISYDLIKDVFDLDNPLTLEYFELCSVAYEGKGEKHHILPSSIYPKYTSDARILVNLSYQNHYKAHEILAQICLTEHNKIKMLHAWNLISNTREGIFIDSETYEILKLTRIQLLSQKMSGCGNPMYGKIGELSTCFGRTGEKHPMFGKHHTEESKRKTSAATRGENNPGFGKIGELSPVFGRKHTPEALLLMSKAQKGKIVSDETRAKQSEVARNRPPRSAETRAKMSLIHTGFVHTEESKLLMSARRSKYNYEQYSKEGELLKIFATQKELREAGFNPIAISGVCRGICYYHKGFHWKKIPKLTLDEKL